MLYLILIIIGAALPLSFAPIGWYFLPFILLPFLYHYWHCSPNTAFFRGWLFGLAFFGVGVSWVFVSIHIHGNTSMPLAALFTSIFIATLALFPASLSYLLNYLFRENTSIKWLIGLPTLWVLFEWLRSWLLTGFPWLLLGYSQVDSPLRSFIPIFGALGTSFIVVFSSMLIAIAGQYAFKQRYYFKSAMSLIIFILIIILAQILSTIEWTEKNGKKATVSLIQGNIPQPLKWSPNYLQLTYDTYEKLTQQHWQSDIIIWPETAIPTPYKYAQSFIKPLSQTAKQHNTALILGAPVAANAMDYHNAMIFEGTASGQYHKKHLVPFGEYLPFDSFIRGMMNFFDIPMSNFIPGEQSQVMLQANNMNIAPFICYEIAYSSAIKQYLPEADILITLNNMAWFGDSLAPGQHLQIARNVALQTGRYHLFVSNDGVTAVINPLGKVQSHLPQFSEGVLTAEVYGMKGSTVWLILGEKNIITFMMLLLLTGVCINLNASLQQKNNLCV